MVRKLSVGIHLCLSVAYPDSLMRDVTIIDDSTGTIHPKHSILIRGERIVVTGREIPAPKGVEVIDGAGRFAIPGLWDMHVHLNDREQLALYPAHPVTGVRDLDSDLHRAKDWRHALDKGELPGPQSKPAGLHSTRSGRMTQRFPMVRSPTDARVFYESLDDRSADFIGVLPRLPRDAYFARTERARKYHSPVAGAVPATVSALE